MSYTANNYPWEIDDIHTGNNTWINHRAATTLGGPSTKADYDMEELFKPFIAKNHKEASVQTTLNTSIRTPIHARAIKAAMIQEAA